MTIKATISETGSVGLAPQGPRGGLAVELDSAPGELPEATVFRLYDAGLLTRRDIAGAVMRLRLKLPFLASAFGYSELGEFLHEFVGPAGEDPLDDRQTRSPWSYQEMVKVTTDCFVGGATATQIAERIGRSPASVRSFFHRCFEQGYVVRVFVWELLREGYSWQEVADAGYPPRRCEFTSDLMRLADYCRTRGLPAPVLRFKE